MRVNRRVNRRINRRDNRRANRRVDRRDSRKVITGEITGMSTGVTTGGSAGGSTGWSTEGLAGGDDVECKGDGYGGKHVLGDLTNRTRRAAVIIPTANRKGKADEDKK